MREEKNPAENADQLRFPTPMHDSKKGRIGIGKKMVLYPPPRAPWRSETMNNAEGIMYWRHTQGVRRERSSKPDEVEGKQ